jgi:hypothetical protein
MNLSKDSLTLIVVVLILVGLWYISYPDRNCEEKFDSDMRSFVPIGSQRYGLRGDKLTWYDIAQTYLPKSQNKIINSSGGEIANVKDMSNAPNCKKVTCPDTDYFKGDTCWACSEPAAGSQSNQNLSRFNTCSY